LSKMRPTPELKDKKPKVDAIYDPTTGQFRRPK